MNVQQWRTTVLLTPLAYVQVVRLFRKQRHKLQITPKEILFQVAKGDLGAVLYAQMYHRKNIQNPEVCFFSE